jgi:hypothetical protein
MPTRYRGKSLGSLALEEAYIYPKFVGPMTPPEVLQAVAGLMNRSGSVPPALVTFRDGSRIRAVPVSLQVRKPGQVEVEFLDINTNTSRVVGPNEVVNIQ